MENKTACSCKPTCLTGFNPKHFKSFSEKNPIVFIFFARFFNRLNPIAFFKSKDTNHVMSVESWYRLFNQNSG